MMKTRMVVGAALLSLATAASAQPPRGHDPMAMIDADGNGEISLAEIRQHAASAFREIDADGDGRATPAEFRAHHEKMRAGHEGGPGHEGRRGPPPPGEGHRGPPRMERLDSNGDGNVSAAEFAAGIEQHFARADANADGKVTREELAAAHAGMRKRP